MVLVGFMVILTSEMVRAFPNAILNVHPALIPPSRGRAAMASMSMRRPWSTGSSCPAPPSTSSARSATAAPSSYKRRWRSSRTTPPEVLQRRIMEQCEWKLLPRAVSLFCQGLLKVEGRLVRVLDRPE